MLRHEPPPLRDFAEADMAMFPIPLLDAPALASCSFAWECPRCGFVGWTPDPAPRCGRCAFWDTAS